MEKLLKVYATEQGKKIKTSGLTLNQNSSNNTLEFVTLGDYDSVEVYFRNPSGRVSPKYHMIYSGQYVADENDTEAVILNNTMYVWKFDIPFDETSFTMTGATARMEASFGGYSYNNKHQLRLASTANSQITINASNASDTLDEGYNQTDVENLWKAVGEIAKNGTPGGDGTIDESKFYTKTDTDLLLSGKANANETYTKAQTNSLVANKADSTSVYNKETVDNKLANKADSALVYNKTQVDNLLSSKVGENNLKTVGGKSLLGTGDIAFPTPVVDSSISTTSSNALANKTIAAKFNEVESEIASKQDTLVPGSGISIVNGVITASAGLDVTVVNSLPSVGDTEILYLVKNDKDESDNYDEYIYVNNKWEKIGNSAVDLTNYYTKSEVSNLLAGKVGTTQLKTINGNTIVGTGDIVISASGDVDSELSATSSNPVQNKIITGALNNKANNSDVYIKSEVDSKLSEKASVSSVNSGLNAKQNTLVSGTNIKTINGKSVLGSGNIEVQGILTPGLGITIDSNNNISTDTSALASKDALNTAKTDLQESIDNLSSDLSNFRTDTTNNLSKKQNVLTPGNGITIAEDGTISATGTLKFNIVSTLPTSGSTNIIYLVPKNDAETIDSYDEYIYVSNKFEKIGDTNIDLSDFYTKENVDTMLTSKQDVLTSGSNIKTINGESILGDGDVTVTSNGTTVTYDEDDSCLVIESTTSIADVLNSQY